MVHVSVGSLAGACSVGEPAFFRYVVRLSEVGFPLGPAEREATAILSAIPNAYADDEEDFGIGWRVVPAGGDADWSVLETSPQRLRKALETARRLLWTHAGPFAISARELVAIEDELERVLGVVARAEAGGYSVNVSYVS
ncbi:MAG: hypothetical protein ACREM2_04265 [Vulcanimicrobiaceae bacterium]